MRYLCFFIFFCFAGQLIAAPLPHIPEARPYPEVENISIDGIGFGFRTGFSTFSHPKIDYSSTLSRNFSNKKISPVTENLIKSFCEAYPEDSTDGIGRRFKYVIKDDGGFVFRPTVIYTLLVDEEGYLFEFEKEISVSDYLLKRKVNLDELIAQELKSFPKPHFTQKSENGITKITSLWWGVDHAIMNKGGSFSIANASWARQFWGKVVEFKKVESKSGCNIYISLVDNYQQYLRIIRTAP